MTATAAATAPDKPQSIKCLVWDLDNTLWRGILLEGDEVTVSDEVRHIVQTLDERGILQSVASKNEPEVALQKLRELGLADYFLYPQIGWGSKALAVKAIAEAINIGLDAVAFVDDQAYERDEVAYTLPEVLCLDAAGLPGLLDRPELTPRFVTKDSRLRRALYQSDVARNQVEQTFAGPQEAFLASLNMALTIFPARAEDLQRAEELTVRTHQLNATGYTYSYEELDHFSQSAQHRLLMARLEDRFGPYGHIGLALVACEPGVWTIKLLLMSCRVMSRGVGSIMLSHILHLARENGVRLRAELVPTARNRLMDVAYRFAGFRERERLGDLVLFEHDLDSIPPYPGYVQIRIEG